MLRQYSYLYAHILSQVIGMNHSISSEIGKELG
jgi:hypothetical protein